MEIKTQIKKHMKDFSKSDLLFSEKMLEKQTLSHIDEIALYSLLEKYTDISKIKKPNKIITEKKALVENNIVKIKFNCISRQDFDATKNHVASIPGRKFDAKEKLWTAPISIQTFDTLHTAGFDLCNISKQMWKDLQEKIESINGEVANIEFENNLLREYQVPHAKKIIASILKYNSALDASATGTGKTYISLAVAKHLGLTPICLVTKTTIPQWEQVATYLGLESFFVLNYEQFKNSNTEFLDITNEKIKDEKGKTKTITKSKWNVTDKHIIIFDEAHKCKNYKTINSKMLIAAKNTEAKIVLLSATLADHPLQLYAAGLVLELFSDYHSFWIWTYDHGIEKAYFGYDFVNEKENIKKIHNDIFPEHGARMTSDNLPENTIIAQAFNMGTNTKKIKSIHEHILELNKKREKDKGAHLTERLRARQEIEILKVPTIIEQAQNLIEEGNAVVVFVNFKETIKILSKELKTTCIIDGSTSADDREINRVAFQEDKQRIIICNMRSGGVGISLHDIHGKYPRVSLISPSDSAIDLKQCFGRICRDGGMSPAIQYILFCAGTIEQEIAKNVQAKIDRIDLLNDGDLAI